MSYIIEDAKIVKDTGKAILVNAPEFNEDVWIPQSQVDDNSEIWKEGESGDLLVTDWFAEKQGWI